MTSSAAGRSRSLWDILQDLRYIFKVILGNVVEEQLEI